MGRILLFLLAAVSLMAIGSIIWFVNAAKGIAPATLEANYFTDADRYVSVAGAKVRVRTEGPAEAPVILLLHGFTYSLESWDAWAGDLARDYRVIRYDLNGHGLTGPDPQERYAPFERAAFVGDVLDALGVDEAIIAGNSLGGLAAWRYAAMEPERVEALILISPGAYPTEMVGYTPADIPGTMKVYLTTAPEAGVKTSAEFVFGDDSKITEARLKTLRDMMRREGNGEAMVKSLEEFTLPDPTDILRTLTVPTLVLWGEADGLLPVAQGRKMAATMPNAQLITYRGVGHAAQEEIPAETLADMRAFLADIGSAERPGEPAPALLDPAAAPAPAQ